MVSHYHWNVATHTDAPINNPYSPRPGESYAMGPQPNYYCEKGTLFRQWGTNAWKRIGPCRGCDGCRPPLSHSELARIGKEAAKRLRRKSEQAHAER